MLNRKFVPEAKIDIKALSLEGMEKGEERWFDPVRDITPVERRGIHVMIENNRLEKKWRFLGSNLSDMRILGDIESIDNQEERGLVSYFDILQSQADTFIVASFAVSMKILGIPIEISEKTKNKIRIQHESYQNTNETDFTSLGAYMRVLDLLSEGIITDEYRDKVQARLDAYRGTKRWIDFIATATNMRMLGIEPDLTLEDKVTMIKKMKQSDTEMFLWYASHL
ncbi:MAG: hypothetical protein Q8P27_03605, partial [Candidatus Peregrinibacteria bacterium]|nr:hypothetical protein [Candidatus Peregrinibacteria bacterium]